MESLDQIIERMKIDLHVPKIDDKELSEASFILIRHGYSEYNHKAAEIVERYGKESEEMLKLKGDANLYDPGLHQIGVLQCETNQPHVNQINFKTVFVSPMRRAVETCVHLFKKHPNKDQIRFIILPIVREVLETANDIARDIDDIMAMYSPESEHSHGISFDFSLVLLFGQPKLWQIFTLANLEK
jgi:hypothetical protein